MFHVTREQLKAVCFNHCTYFSLSWKMHSTVDEKQFSKTQQFVVWRHSFQSSLVSHNTTTISLLLEAVLQTARTTRLPLFPL